MLKEKLQKFPRVTLPKDKQEIHYGVYAQMIGCIGFTKNDDFLSIRKGKFLESEFDLKKQHIIMGDFN